MYKFCDNVLWNIHRHPGHQRSRGIEFCRCIWLFIFTELLKCYQFISIQNKCNPHFLLTYFLVLISPHVNFDDDYLLCSYHSHNSQNIFKKKALLLISITVCHPSPLNRHSSFLCTINTNKTPHCIIPPIRHARDSRILQVQRSIS
jgi:hypothetical protein